jgi:ABC-type ATPase involved in cell division
MSLRSKVEDRINLFLSQDVADEIGRTDVPLDKLEIGQVFDLFQIIEARTVVKLIVDNNVVLRILLAEKNGNMRSNEAWTTNGR